MDINQLIMIMDAGGGGGSTLPVFESFSTGLITASTTHTTNKPTGTASGDLLLWLVSCDTVNATTIDASADGFTQLFFEQGGGATSWDILAVYYKIAGGSEPSSYSFTTSISEASASILCRISGVDGTTPIDGYTLTNNGNSATGTAPTCTTSQDNCLVIRICNARLSGGANGYISATPTTEIARVDDGSATVNAGTSLAASREDKATAGATGTANFTINASTQWMAATIAVAPA